MAVTVEGTPTQYAEYSASSLTWSHTAGGDGLFVGIGQQENINVTGVTFNADALTEKWDFYNTANRTTGYIMVAPDAGAHNVVVSLASSSGTAWAGAVGLTGLDQATPTRTAYTDADSDVTVVDSQLGDLVIDCCMTYNLTIAADGSQTVQVEDDSILGSDSSAGISTESATGANTVMSWTGGTYSAIGAMALVAAAAGGGAPETLRVLTSARWR
jgi:hypothetical protein